MTYAVYAQWSVNLLFGWEENIVQDTSKYSKEELKIIN